MRKLKSKCPRCSGTGFLPDKLWGKRKCDKWNCKKGVIIAIVNTPEEMHREFELEQEKANAQGKL